MKEYCYSFQLEYSTATLEELYDRRELIKLFFSSFGQPYGAVPDEYVGNIEPYLYLSGVRYYKHTNPLRLQKVAEALRSFCLFHNILLDELGLFERIKEE